MTKDSKVLFFFGNVEDSNLLDDCVFASEIELE